MMIAHVHVKKYAHENSIPRVKKDRLFLILLLAEDFLERRREEILDLILDVMEVKREEDLGFSTDGWGVAMSNAPAPYPVILFSCFFTNTYRIVRVARIITGTPKLMI